VPAAGLARFPGGLGVPPLTPLISPHLKVASREKRNLLCHASGGASQGGGPV
jgi:hypothetical protein